MPIGSARLDHGAAAVTTPGLTNGDHTLGVVLTPDGGAPSQMTWVTTTITTATLQPPPPPSNWDTNPTAAPAEPAAWRYIAKLYSNLLGRWADPTGLLYWSSLLQHGAATPDQITTAIANSTEGLGLAVRNVNPWPRR